MQTDYAQNSSQNASGGAHDTDECPLPLEEVHRLENIIQQTKEESMGSLRRAIITGSPTGRVPNEILVAIFTFACPPIDFRTRTFSCEEGFGYDDEENVIGLKDDRRRVQWRKKENLGYRYFPLVLLAVSSRWRQLALSAPGLWTTMALEVDCKKIEKQVAFLRFYLQNSKELLFSLDLDLRRYEEEIEVMQGGRLHTVDPSGPTSLEPIRSLVLDEFAERINQLWLAGQIKDWVSCIPERFPKLTNFAIQSIWSSSKEGSATSPPFLQQVNFANNPSNIPQPLPSSITVIHLHYIPIDRCINLLLNSPQLLEFHNYRPIAPESDPSTSLPKRFTHPNIENFGWDWGEDIEYDIDGLRLPKLRLLRLAGLTRENTGGGRGGIGGLHFFGLLPNTLCSLEFYNIRSSVGERWFSYVHFILGRIWTIEELTFVNCSSSFIQSVFKVLATQVPPPDEYDPIEFLLPRLKVIRVYNLVHGRDSLTINHELHLILGYEFYEYVEGLWSRVPMVSSLRLELVDCALVNSNVFYQEHLRNLVSRGFKLRIVNEAGEVDLGGLGVVRRGHVQGLLDRREIDDL